MACPASASQSIGARGTILLCQSSFFNNSLIFLMSITDASGRNNVFVLEEHRVRPGWAGLPNPPSEKISERGAVAPRRTAARRSWSRGPLDASSRQDDLERTLKNGVDQGQAPQILEQRPSSEVVATSSISGNASCPRHLSPIIARGRAKRRRRRPRRPACAARLLLFCFFVDRLLRGLLLR